LGDESVEGYRDVQYSNPLMAFADSLRHFILFLSISVERNLHSAAQFSEYLFSAPARHCSYLMFLAAATPHAENKPTDKIRLRHFFMISSILESTDCRIDKEISMNNRCRSRRFTSSGNDGLKHMSIFL
jgi:hypothetical protein